MFSRFLIRKLHLNDIAWWKVVMSRTKRRNVYQHMSDFGGDWIIAYYNCGLSYSTIAVLVDRNSMTICRIWNWFVKENHTEHSARLQCYPNTNSREDTHLIRIALMDRTGLELRHDVVCKISVCSNSSMMFAQHGLSARRPWLQLPLRLRQNQDRLQWLVGWKPGVHAMSQDSFPPKKKQRSRIQKLGANWKSIQRRW